MLSLIFSLIFSSLIVKTNLASVSNHLLIYQSQPAQAANAEESVWQVFDQRLPLALNKPRGPQKISSASFGVAVTALSGTVIDWETGKVLWQKAAQEQRPIASITKLMTALIFLDHNPGWNQTLTITVTDQRAGGEAFFQVGGEVTVRDLFYVTLVRSINSAAAALARSTGLTDDEFVAEMNAKAVSLGLTNTHFVEPTGLDARNISTAEDLAILVRKAIGTTAIANATMMSTYTASNNKVAASTDWLLAGSLNQPPYNIVGGKTGYLDEAGYCLALAVEKSGHRVISVILGSSDINSRFTDTKSMVEWAFENYQWE